MNSNNISKEEQGAVEPRSAHDAQSGQGKARLIIERRVAGIHRLTKYTVVQGDEKRVFRVAEQYVNGWTVAGCHFYETQDGKINIALFDKHLYSGDIYKEEYEGEIITEKTVDGLTISYFIAETEFGPEQMLSFLGKMGGGD